MPDRTAGLLLPVFSLRREGGLGIGDTRSMREWIELVAAHGVKLIQLLPINETGSDDSPYNAISSVALDPVYLAMEDVPGVTSESLAKAPAPPSSERVDYDYARQWKRALLEGAWNSWPDAESALHEEFATFHKEESGWLENYCIFRSLVQLAGTERWGDWPEGWQQVDGANAAADGHEDLRAFYAWIQWLCFRQWREVRTFADSRGVRLMGDIPIGVSRNSADVFFGRDDFDLDWCGGAPPETVFKHDAFIRKWGQNWGIPLYRWDKMEREGFPWWRQRVSKLVDIFHVFRIDHVLGFYRIYGFPWQPERNAEFLPLSEKEAKKRTGGVLPRWVPRPDDTKKHCAANRAEGETRLKMVQQAAGDGEVVGEDLGCVPDYVRPHLYSLGICGFRIPHWDFDKKGKVIPGDEIPETSFATYATHDHDSIPAMWADFHRRASAANDDEDDRIETAAGLKRLADFGGIEGLGEFDDDKLWALIDALMACNSRYAAIMVTDLFGMTDRINSPGTVGSANWTFYLPWSAKDCAGRSEWARLAEAIRKGNR
ncbi:4-alpha-glucanotransferase [Haloferula helveola]|uniref:4-alpha-glucanotransferase n=1 Tax=Haloferula helveola TaxID=490095 RepID=A0ABN6H8K9_9BACT|nr:4-alpha-glucanotransferase [Haloferula helveola]